MSPSARSRSPVSPGTSGTTTTWCSARRWNPFGRSITSSRRRSSRSCPPRLSRAAAGFSALRMEFSRRLAKPSRRRPRPCPPAASSGARSGVRRPRAGAASVPRATRGSSARPRPTRSRRVSSPSSPRAGTPPAPGSRSRCPTFPCSSSLSNRRRCSRGSPSSRTSAAARSSPSWAWTCASTTSRSCAYSPRGPGWVARLAALRRPFPPHQLCPPPWPRARYPRVYPRASRRSPWAPRGPRRRLAAAPPRRSASPSLPRFPKFHRRRVRSAAARR
mmetsp:Transcript_8726/g.39689  ORF Transcript_8726/g.39689 Transcript_8726/m.39689 type:complete len:275 (+) Transcript_8726:1308-2132(+)